MHLAYRNRKQTLPVMPLQDNKLAPYYTKNSHSPTQNNPIKGKGLAECGMGGIFRIIRLNYMSTKIEQHRIKEKQHKNTMCFTLSYVFPVFLVSF